MDFKEYLVARKKTPMEVFLSVLLYLAAFILAIVCITLLSAFGGIGALLAVGCFYGAHILSTRFNKEFEYIETEDTVDIDIIYNRSRRKRLASFSVKNIEVLASVDDTQYNSRLKGQFDNVIDATTGRKDVDVYFVIFEKKGKTLVKFEPPYAFVERLSKYSPLKVHVKKF